MSQTTAGTPAPAVTVGVLKETAPGEQRVAIAPESVPVLGRVGVQVLVESGAGAAACFPDPAYQQSGARVLSRDETAARADVLVGVGVPARRRTLSPGCGPGRRLSACCGRWSSRSWPGSWPDSRRHRDHPGRPGGAGRRR